MNRDLIKELQKYLSTEYEYVSVLASKSTGKSYAVSHAGIVAMQNALFCQDGYVVKVYKDGGYCEYSFNELSKEDFEAISISLKDMFKVKKQFEENNQGKAVDKSVIGVNNYPVLEDEECISFTENEIHDNPIELGDEYIITRLKEIREKALSVNEKIFDARLNAQYKVYEKYFKSNNKEMSQKILWMCCSINMMAKSGEVIKSYFKSYSNRDGANVLDNLEKDIKTVADCAVELLDAQAITPGEYDCICTPEVTGMIVHEAFGHGVEMDMFVKDRALAREYIGKQVASELVTMHDGAKAATEVATYDFDDEGMLGCDTVIIEKGILKTGICDAQAAMALNVKSTGNGRRENYERKAYTRMTNTFFEGGNDKLEDMIASIEDGYLLENATCGMEDPKNWGIQCMVNMAREIKNGKLTGKVYSPIVLSGYVPDLLKSISMMSENVHLGGGGFCGKGYKEWVKVSDGGPYIKAKIKLG